MAEFPAMDKTTRGAWKLPALIGALLLVLGLPGIANDQGDTANYTKRKIEAEVVLKEGVTPFLKTYCTKCHSNRRSKTGVNFEAALKLPRGATSSQQWKMAVASVKAHDMPPIDADKIPSHEERARFIEWIGKLKYLSPKDPGPFVIRRLTKVEYGNTLQALYGVEASLADDLPDEVFGEGYLNSLSPLQSELFLSIANKVLKQILTPRNGAPSPTQRRLFGETPGEGADLRSAARRVALSMAREAYRRPPSSAEVDTLVQVFDVGRDNNLDYQGALGLMLKAVLVSPQFLFIVAGRGGGSLQTGRFLDNIKGNQGDLLTTLLSCAGVPLDRPIGIATKELKAIKA